MSMTSTPISFQFVIGFFATILIGLVLTPIIKLITFRMGAVDLPNERRINKKPMPTAGGVSIFITFAFSCLFIFHNIIPLYYIVPVLLAALIVVITGFIDDVVELSPRSKMLGVVLAALVVYYFADVRFDSMTFFFIGKVELGWLSLPFTVLWIAAITHAINLIDGLDGLASGISLIALMTMGITGYFFLHVSTSYIPIVIFILVASIFSFFPYNFYPAKIYLGDTGALFLGFMIAVLSLQGLKNATFISLLTPLVILGVPITDTVFAIIRRTINRQPISSADKMHLHHRLLSLGFTHRGAVLTIYCLALVFSFISLLFNYTSLWGLILLVIACLFGLELFIEMIGLVGENHRPLLYVLHLLGNKEFRDSEMEKRKFKKK